MSVAAFFFLSNSVFMEITVLKNGKVSILAQAHY